MNELSLLRAISSYCILIFYVVERRICETLGNSAAVLLKMALAFVGQDKYPCWVSCLPTIGELILSLPDFTSQR